MTDEKKELYEICPDCGVNVYDIGEAFYKVTDEVWEKSEGGKHVLCIGCLEKRIGRLLTVRDFPDVPINRRRSQRLVSRMNSTPFTIEMPPCDICGEPSVSLSASVDGVYKRCAKHRGEP